MSKKERDKIPLETVRLQMDPFYNECRAYGRLIDRGVNGKVAVRCHGHLFIPAAMEEELAQRFEVYTWNRPSDESRLMMSKRQPLRAIVKDLIQDDTALDKRMLSRMRKDLLKIRKLGVNPKDVRLRNYGDGHLLDFSIAITKPHWFLHFKEPWMIRTMEKREMQMFQQLIVESDVRTSLRATRNREYCAKLRGCPFGRETRRKRYPA